MAEVGLAGGVSMRTTASKETVEPSTFCAVTATVRGGVASLSAVRLRDGEGLVPSNRETRRWPARDWRGPPCRWGLERWNMGTRR